MTIDRRAVLALGGAAIVAGAAAMIPGRPAEAVPGRFPFRLTDAQWRARLNPHQYAVLREAQTERPGSSPLNEEHRRGTFACAGCARPLFSSTTKFDSGTGWPSFYKPLDNAIGTTVDKSFFMTRTEVHCRRCGGHLGHVFDDGPQPTGLRYCMNGVAMNFHTA